MRARGDGWSRRRVALGLLHRFVVGIGRIDIAAAVLEIGLDPVELRRGRRHIGIGAPRGPVGLGCGAAEIVGIGGDVAETAYARRLGIAVVAGAARRGQGWRRACAIADRRQLRLLHRDLRLRRHRRLRPWRRRRIGPRGTRRTLRILPERRPIVARGGGAGGGADGRGRAVGAVGWPFDGADGSPGRAPVERRKASPREEAGAVPPARASRARWAASDSTLRTASSSDSRSRVISDSESGGWTLRSWEISAARARS